MATLPDPQERFTAKRPPFGRAGAAYAPMSNAAAKLFTDYMERQGHGGGLDHDPQGRSRYSFPNEMSLGDAQNHLDAFKAELDSIRKELEDARAQQEAQDQTTPKHENS
jgi:hypothetical protein